MMSYTDKYIHMFKHLNNPLTDHCLKQSEWSKFLQSKSLRNVTGAPVGHTAATSWESV